VANQLTTVRSLLLAFRICLAVGLLVSPKFAAAQDHEGSAGSIVAGATLGAFSGSLVTNIGSIVWCTETAMGATCVRWASIIGAAIGGTAGGMLGEADTDRLRRTAVRSLFGFGIGGAFGVLSMRAKSAIKWRDALMVGAIGGAIGAQPFGAMIGFAGGTMVGLALETVSPGFGLPEVAGAALAGMAVGVLSAWVISASDARANNELVLTIPLVRLSL
jgi:hypothetical protein